MATLFILAAAAAIFLLVSRRGRLGGKPPLTPPPKSPGRAAKEGELLLRLERLRGRRGRVADAVAEDPERAARIVSRMMKDRK